MHVWAGTIGLKEDREDPENLPLLYARGDVGERTFELQRMKCGSVDLYGADVRAVIEPEDHMHTPSLWAGPLREKAGASKLNPDRSPSERELGVVVGFRQDDYDVQLRRKGDTIMLFVSFGWSLDEIELPPYWHDSELLWRWSPYPERRAEVPGKTVYVVVREETDAKTGEAQSTLERTYLKQSEAQAWADVKNEESKHKTRWLEDYQVHPLPLIGQGEEAKRLQETEEP